jgi:hypothetical protein
VELGFDSYRGNCVVLAHFLGGQWLIIVLLHIYGSYVMILIFHPTLDCDELLAEEGKLLLQLLT